MVLSGGLSFAALEAWNWDKPNAQNKTLLFIYINFRTRFYLCVYYCQLFLVRVGSAKHANNLWQSYLGLGSQWYNSDTSSRTVKLFFSKNKTVDMIQASKSGKNVISFWCTGPEEDQYYVEHCHSTSRGYIGNCGRWHFYCGTLPTAW